MDGGVDGIYDAGHGDSQVIAKNCIDTYPWLTEDYHLHRSSPCINTGDPNYEAEPNETDLDGNPRIFNNRIDMGAYESIFIPIIQINTEQFEFVADKYNPEPESQILTIQNIGHNTLNWQISYDCNWLEVSPVHGSSVVEVNEVVLNVNVSDITPGIYSCNLVISDPCALNSPQIVQVDLTVLIGGDILRVPQEYPTVQDALGAAIFGDEIWVAQGSYLPDRDSNNPDGTGDRNAIFQLKNGVALYGGFPPGATRWQHRNPELFKTVLSGDLNNNDEPNFVNYDENSYTVVNGSGTDSIAVLDGFVITGGNNDFVSGLATVGGGMINREGSPTVLNCTFQGNRSSMLGGGACNLDSNTKFINCKFIGNRAGNGGAVYNTSWRSDLVPSFINCTFYRNTATRGGAVENSHLQYDLVSSFINCVFIENHSTDEGGAMYNWRSSPKVINCFFIGNLADNYGGGMYNEHNCSPTVTNCTFFGNSAEFGDGGGIYNENNPYKNNPYYDDSTPNVTNCILWNNSDSGGVDKSAQICGGIPVINYNCIQGWTIDDANYYHLEPFAYWKFDEDSGNTAYDSAGSNNGNITGAAWTTGQVNSALNFDGGDFVDCGNDSSLVMGTSERTITAWFKTTTTTLYTGILNTWDGGISRDNYRLMVNEGNAGKVSFVIYDGSSRYRAISTTNVSDGDWHFVVGVRDSDSIKIYVDGVEENSTALPSSANIANSANLKIGRAYANGWDFDGKIDEVAIYGHALSAEDIEILYLNSLDGYGYLDSANGGNPLMPETGNIDVDPCFVDPDNNDYHLLPESPCIDAGDPNYITEPNETDLDGNIRIINEIIDMGAFEFQPLIPVELLLDLTDYIDELSLRKGIANSLQSKLETALQKLEDDNVNNDKAAINSLEAFINAVEAHRGKKILEGDADVLIAAAEEIIELLSDE